MDMDCIGDLGFLDPELLQLNEVSPLAIKFNPYVAEKLLDQRLSLSETTLLVIIILLCHFFNVIWSLSVAGKVSIALVNDFLVFVVTCT